MLKKCKKQCDLAKLNAVLDAKHLQNLALYKAAKGALNKRGITKKYLCIVSVGLGAVIGAYCIHKHNECKRLEKTCEQHFNEYMDNIQKIRQDIKEKQNKQKEQTKPRTQVQYKIYRNVINDKVPSKTQIKTKLDPIMGKRIKGLRKQIGMTRRDLCAISGIPEDILKKIEDGKFEDISVADQAFLLKVLQDANFKVLIPKEQ